MQTARHLVTALVEFTAGMENRQNDFKRRLALFFVESGRDASAVVLDCNGVIFIDRHIDIGAVACERFVDGVVDHLIDQMMETFFADVADVHGGTLAYGLQSFEHLDIRCGIFLFLFLDLFLFGTHFVSFKIMYKNRCFFRIVQYGAVGFSVLL